tara:strand:+ start:269 stop:487 length:219 start_codon:yes stop_codon:yes gene_type:complete
MESITGKPRGRLPGQLKGKKYNVPKRVQITVNLLEADLVALDLIADQKKITRSRLLGSITSDFLSGYGVVRA